GSARHRPTCGLRISTASGPPKTCHRSAARPSHGAITTEAPATAGNVSVRHRPPERTVPSGSTVHEVARPPRHSRNRTGPAATWTGTHALAHQPGSAAVSGPAGPRHNCRVPASQAATSATASALRPAVARQSPDDALVTMPSELSCHCWKIDPLQERNLRGLFSPFRLRHCRPSVMAPYWVNVHDWAGPLRHCTTPMPEPVWPRHSREWFSWIGPAGPVSAGWCTCQLNGVAASTEPLLSDTLTTGS